MNYYVLNIVLKAGLLETRAVVDTLSSTVSRQSRFFDCRHAIPAVSTENSEFKAQK